MRDENMEFLIYNLFLASTYNDDDHTLSYIQSRNRKKNGFSYLY